MMSAWDDLLEPIPIASPELNKAKLVEEMENIIPLIATHEDVEAYDLAKTLCSPDVIQSEADPYRFLEYCNFNTWEASKRMIDYWKLRLEIFGRDRFWKRVLDTTGTEALHPECIRAVTRTLYLLPPDRHGRVVLYHQVDYIAERNHAEIQSEHRNAIIFYGLQLAASQRSSLTNGFIFIQLRTAADYKFYPEAQRTFSVGTKSCFPMACKGVHLICTPKNRGNIMQRFSDQVLPFIWKILEKVVSHAEHRTLDFISWSQKRERKEKLSHLLTTKFGLQPKGLPEIAGGSWNYRKSSETYRPAFQPKCASLSSNESKLTTIGIDPMNRENLQNQTLTSASNTTTVSEAPPSASEDEQEEHHWLWDSNPLNKDFFLLYRASQILERKRQSQSMTNTAYVDTIPVGDSIMLTHPTESLEDGTMDPVPLTKRSRLCP